MKKFILAVAVATTMLAGQAQAHGYYGGGYHGGYGYNGGWGNNWVGPAVAGLVIGGVIGAATQPVYAPQPQVIYQQQPQVIYQQVPAYGPPVQVSCVPAYTAQGQYLGCMR